MSSLTDEKERAKRIILEIIRQNGGVLENKTNLFKAFYHAHLRFSESQRGYLSCWPIVRMPRGPGIDKSDLLIEELVKDGLLHVGTVAKGDFDAYCFTLTDGCKELAAISDEAVLAIQKGLEEVRGKSAAEVSHDSHVKSRAWRNATKDGVELNIYSDSVSDEEYAKQMEIARGAGADLRACW